MTTNSPIKEHDFASKLLNTSELAKYLGVNDSTLRQYRIKGNGPTYIKIGHLVRYKISDIEEWLNNLSKKHTYKEAKKCITTI